MHCSEKGRGQGLRPPIYLCKIHPWPGVPTPQVPGKAGLCAYVAGTMALCCSREHGSNHLSKGLSLPSYFCCSKANRDRNSALSLCSWMECGCHCSERSRQGSTTSPMGHALWGPGSFDISSYKFCLDTSPLGEWYPSCSCWFPQMGWAAGSYGSSLDTMSPGWSFLGQCLL